MSISGIGFVGALKKRLFIILLISACCSCSPQRISKHNHVQASDYLYFTNRKVKLSVRFFGDYEFYVPERNSAELLLFQRMIAKYSVGGIIQPGRMIYANRTIISPFFFGGSWASAPSAWYAEKIKEDFVFNQSQENSCFEKTGLFEDINTAWIIRIYPTQKKHYVFMAYLKADGQANYRGSDALLDLIKSEYHHIFGSIKIGSGAGQGQAG
jgi:hypothetical protein